MVASVAAAADRDAGHQRSLELEHRTSTLICCVVQLQGGLAVAPSLQQQTAMLSVLSEQLTSSATGLASVQWLNLTYCPATRQNTFNVGITSVGRTAELLEVTARQS